MADGIRNFTLRVLGDNGYSMAKTFDGELGEMVIHWLFSRGAADPELVTWDNLNDDEDPEPTILVQRKDLRRVVEHLVNYEAYDDDEDDDVHIAQEVIDWIEDEVGYQQDPAAMQID